jgi:hypothetical protein
MSLAELFFFPQTQPLASLAAIVLRSSRLQVHSARQRVLSTIADGASETLSISPPEVSSTRSGASTKPPRVNCHGNNLRRLILQVLSVPCPPSCTWTGLLVATAPKCIYQVLLLDETNLQSVQRRRADRLEALLSPYSFPLRNKPRQHRSMSSHKFVLTKAIARTQSSRRPIEQRRAARGRSSEICEIPSSLTSPVLTLALPKQKRLIFCRVGR